MEVQRGDGRIYITVAINEKHMAYKKGNRVSRQWSKDAEHGVLEHVGVSTIVIDEAALVLFARRAAVNDAERAQQGAMRATFRGKKTFYLTPKTEA